MTSRFIVAVILILFLTPQTSITYYNYVVESLHSTGIFFNYVDVKQFVFRLTWVFVFLFIILNFFVIF